MIVRPKRETKAGQRQTKDCQITSVLLKQAHVQMQGAITMLLRLLAFLQGAQALHCLTSFASAGMQSAHPKHFCNGQASFLHPWGTHI